MKYYQSALTVPPLFSHNTILISYPFYFSTPLQHFIYDNLTLYFHEYQFFFDFFTIPHFIKTLFHSFFHILTSFHHPVMHFHFLNFNHIHFELFDTLISFIQLYSNPLFNKQNIKINFIFHTPHLSFIPNNIINMSHIISSPKKTPENYHQLLQVISGGDKPHEEETKKDGATGGFIQRITKEYNPPSLSMIYKFEPYMHNVKQLYSLSLIDKIEDRPKDLFEMVCNSIIYEIENYKNIVMTKFRDTLYEILIYNLDIYDCLWFIIQHFINKKTHPRLLKEGTNKILEKTHSFLKYYNNNYRPIYHLESMFYYIIIQLHSLDE